jgi:hypothetical protein
MPGTIVNSVAAAEFNHDPKTAYHKYTPDNIFAIALGSAKGGADGLGNYSPDFYDIYNELDGQRAAYVSGADITYDEKIRLRRAHDNGDLVLPADRLQRADADKPKSEIGKMPGAKEAAALTDVIDQVTFDQQQQLSPWNMNASLADKARANAEKARTIELANRILTPIAGPPPVPGAGGVITADQSRALSSMLTSSIFGPTATGLPGLAPNITAYHPTPLAPTLPAAVPLYGANSQGRAPSLVDIAYPQPQRPAPVPVAPPKVVIPPAAQVSFDVAVAKPPKKAVAPSLAPIIAWGGADHPGGGGA